MIAGGIERDREFLERYNPNRDRAEFEHAWNDLLGARGFRQQSYEPHYEGSSVVSGPRDGVCSIHGKHSYAASAGHHLTPWVLSSGRNVYEELDPGFTLLALEAEDAAVESFRQSAQALNLPLKVLRDSYDGGRETLESRMVLVRPDQYVVWAGDQAPPDATAILKMATGGA
jgi:hypothetical protein